MLSPKVKEVIRYHTQSIVSFTALLAVIIAFMCWQNFRWYWNVLFYLAAYFLLIMLARRIGSRLRRTVSEEEQITVEDNFLGDKKPSKDWYFFP